MGLYIKSILICVSFFIILSGADDQNKFINLDISNVSSYFYVIDSPCYKRILLDASHEYSGKCAGKVSDGANEILGQPESNASKRFVVLVKFPKQSDYNPELHDIFKNENDKGSGDAGTDFELIVEVHTLFKDAKLLDRFKKNDENKYERFEYDKVDLDICGDIDKENIRGKNHVKIAKFKTVGAIKCKDKLLLDSLNVFYRAVLIQDDSFLVKTIPKFGIVNQETFVFDKNKEYAVRKSHVFTNLSFNPSKTNKYSKIASLCGNDCMFFDGCNENVRLLDVVDDSKQPQNGSQGKIEYLYKNPKSLCISVKTQEVREDKYLTVFDLQKNSEMYNVKVFKKTENGYVDHVKQLIDFNVTDFADPKPVYEYSYRHLLEKEDSGDKIRVRSNDIDFRIGKVYYKNNLVIEEGEGVFNREVYSCKDGVLVRDECYNGEFKKYLFKPEKPTDNSSNEQGGSTSSEPTKLKLAVEDPVKVDLHKITAHVTKYLTDSNNNLFVKPSTFVDKLGSLSYDTVNFCPNRFFVSRQYLIMDNKHMELHSITRRGFSFFETFVMVHSLKKDDQVFVTKGKEPVQFDVSLFYESVSKNNFSNLSNFDICDLGDYYFVGINYKKIFTHVIGNVTLCNDGVITPFDMDLTSRFIVLPKTTQSYIILKDCDYSDCWLKLYAQTSKHGIMSIEIQKKESNTLDLAKLYENAPKPTDSEGNPTPVEKSRVFTFDQFIVFNYGIVYNVRVKDELTQKIGKVVYGDTVIADDDDNVFTRMVNVSSKPETGTLRILNIERWDKHTKLYEYSFDTGTNQFTFKEKDKTDMIVDIEPLARHSTLLNVTEHNEVLSYSVPWNVRDDHTFKGIQYSEYDYVNKNFNSTSVKENMSKSPLFVRLHRDPDGDGSGSKVVLVVENHPEKETAENDKFFKQKNAANKGAILTYDINNKNSGNLNQYPKDSYHRRNYTSHHHPFEVDS
uniref:6-Cys domain-containing protein n=1 Tax=Theileria annulata TaxID=5874 RepID=A0A3B0NAG3_THEAN